MLEPLGVDEATFAVYHALLSHPDSTPEQIAALVNRSTNDVQDLMDQAPKPRAPGPDLDEPGR